MANFKIDFNVNKVVGNIRVEVYKRMVTVAAMLEAYAKNLVNRGNITRKNPAMSGEPPKVVTGALKRAITHKVKIKSGDVVGQLGIFKSVGFSGKGNTPVAEYAAYLELGRHTSTGFKKWPFLRPTYLQNTAKILKMLSN